MSAIEEARSVTTLARRLGWRVRNAAVKGIAPSFQLGDRWIWHTRKGWMTATLNKQSRYVGHNVLTSLEHGIKRFAQ